MPSWLFMRAALDGWAAGDGYVIPARRPVLIVPIVTEGHAYDPMDASLLEPRPSDFQNEEIMLTPHDVGPYRALCGYGPRTKVWAVADGPVERVRED